MRIFRTGGYTALCSSLAEQQCVNIVTLFFHSYNDLLAKFLLLRLFSTEYRTNLSFIITSLQL